MLTESPCVRHTSNVISFDEVNEIRVPMILTNLSLNDF